MIRHKAVLLAVLALLVGGPAVAQVGVLDQPYRNDLFQPLLSGRFSFTHYLSAGADNNTLAVGDLVALGILAEASLGTDIPGIGPTGGPSGEDGFRPTDLFLLAGLVPAGEGIRLGTHDRTGLVVTVPTGPLVTVGLMGGVRLLGSGQIPDDLAALARDGVAGDSITVNLTEMGGEMFGYAEMGANALLNLEVLPTPFGDISVLAGAGARYVRGLAHLRFGFAGDSGEETSTFTVARTGVSTDLHMSTPIGEEVLAEGGGGVAMDVMVGATLGHRAQLRLAVTDLGTAEVTVGQRQVTSMELNDVSFLELGGDSASVTDTLASATRSIALPTTFRADATFRPINMIGIGARIALPMDSAAFAFEPLYQVGLELRLLPALPLRAGMLGGGEFGTGYFAGFGLDTRVFGFELEMASSGGPAVADIRGVSLRSALSLRF